MKWRALITCVFSAVLYPYLNLHMKSLGISIQAGSDCVINFLEVKYVERWPNTTSAWAGWSRFDIPVDRYGGVLSQLFWTSSTLGFPTRLASRIILNKQNIKKRTGPALCVHCDWFLCSIICTVKCTVYVHCTVYICTGWANVRGVLSYLSELS